MKKIEVYERVGGRRRGLGEKDGLLCTLEAPPSGAPLRGDVVAVPGHVAGEPASLLAFFRVIERCSTWTPVASASDGDLSLSLYWIEVERVANEEL